MKKRFLIKKDLIMPLVYFFRQSTKMLSKIFPSVNGATFAGNLDPYYLVGVKHLSDSVRNRKKMSELLFFILPILIIAILQFVSLDNLNIIKFLINILKIIICISIMLYFKNKKINIDMHKICKIITILFCTWTIISFFLVNNTILWRNNDYTNVFDLKRLQLFYLEPSELGFHISIVIVILFSLWLNETNKSKRKKIFLLLLANFIPLYLSKSLGAIGVLLITILLMIIYDLITKFNKRKFVQFFLCFIVVLISGVFLIQSNNSLMNRFIRVVNGDDGSVNYRINVSMEVLGESLNDYNYFGCGFGNVNTPEFINRYSYLKLDQMIVNSFIYFWTETGVLGMLYWIFLMWYILKKCYKSKNITKIGLFLYIIIFQFLGSHFTNGLIWLIYGFIISKEEKKM